MPYADPEAQRAYQREWVAARRAAWFDGKFCVDCGAMDELEVDHVDPATKVSHRIWSWSQERRDAELAKCVVRCSDCHRDRHSEPRIRHGRKRYQRGCRCDVCRSAKRVDNARRRRPRVCEARDGAGRLVVVGDRVRVEVPGRAPRYIDRRELAAAIAA